MPNLEKNAMQNEWMTNKMMIVLVMACAYVMLVMGIRWGYQSENFLFFYTGTKILLFVSLAAAGFGMIKALIDRKNSIDTSQKLFSGVFIASSAALLAYTCYRMAYTDTVSAAKFLYVLIPALGALYLINMIYRREFFALTFAGAVTTLYIWQYARNNANTLGFVICQIVLLLGLAAVIAAFVWMERTGGTITIGDVQHRFLPEDSVLKPTIAGLCILFILVAAMFFVPANLFIYFAYVSVAMIFSFAVYYTVLML